MREPGWQRECHLETAGDHIPGRSAWFEETVALVNRAGGQAMSLTGDITNGGLVQEMIGSVIAAYGRLDCAFNNAGFASW